MEAKVGPLWMAIVRPQRMCITKVGHLCRSQLSDQVPPNCGQLMALVLGVTNGPPRSDSRSACGTREGEIPEVVSCEGAVDVA